MNDIFKLTPEDIAQYREQFSQNNQEEALYALDVIEEKNGNLIIAASELAIEENIVVSKSISNILDKLAKKSRNIVCDEEFIDKVMDGLLSSAVASLCTCLLYTSPSPRDMRRSRMPSSAWKKKT